MKILLDPKSTDGGYTPPKANVPTPITVEQPSTPPPEVLSREFKLDETIFDHKPEEGKVTAEDKLGNQTEVKTIKSEEEQKKEVVKPKEEAKVKEEKKEEPKSILKPPTPEKKEAKTKVEKEEVKPIVPPSKEKVVRDYSGYSEEEVTHLKQMSDPAYKYVTELLKKTKDSSSDTFLQHPEAYTLSPGYSTLQTKSTFAKKEGDYWQSCLEALEAGKPIKDLIGWNQDGSPRFGEEFQPNKRVEELARMAMNNCYNVARTTQDELHQYPNQFKTRVQNDLQAIQSERVKRFGWVADPKLMDYTLDMGPDGEVAIKDIRQNIINLFPPYLRSNPATDVAADLFVAMRIQDAELREARNGKQVADIKKEEQERAEPKSEVKPGKQPATIGGVREFNLAGMPS